jgi:hypothetical protein
MGIRQSVFFLEYEMNDREVGVQFPAQARGFPLLPSDRLLDVSAYRPTGNEEECGTWKEINQSEREGDYSLPSSVDTKNVLSLNSDPLYIFTA